MKKISLILVSLLALTACTPQQKAIDYPILPEGLKDCKFFYISNGETSMQVARCPNSATSTQYSSGKTTATAVVIDGVEYVKK